MSSEDRFFTDGFKALTGNAPFEWQKRLFADFVAVPSKIRPRIALPTGLGKTSVVTIWLLALAYQASKNQVTLPRRLIYVVNRRTVVDQVTTTAELLRKALQKEDCAELQKYLGSLCSTKEVAPLAISTLRGEFADNKEWQNDPCRPSIIIGTVDMIGSRLLFSGYGVSRTMRPFHAGLLGQDSLVVHDEAHLTPAFGKLLKGIVEKQKDNLHPMQYLELSATLRDDSKQPDSEFQLEEDKEDERIKKRVSASKTLKTDTSQKDIVSKVSKLALRHVGNQKRVLVYVTKPQTAVEVAKVIAKEAGKDCVKVLTGTLRGYDRDLLAKDELFKGFQSQFGRTPPEKSEYLISTSAGEVGVDLDADAMISELSTLDSIIQRLGRVNRLGESNTAEVYIVGIKSDLDKAHKQRSERTKAEEVLDDASASKSQKKKAQETIDKLNKDDLPERKTNTWELLHKLDYAKSASPNALQDFLSKNKEECKKAFSKEPVTEPLTDILLDNWSMTSASDLPGKLPVANWLHGIQDNYRPSLYVAWRGEIDYLDSVNNDELNELFDKHPIASRERLRGNYDDVIEELIKIRGRHDKESKDIKAVFISANGNTEYISLKDIEGKNQKFAEGTIVLPVSAGGLSDDGMLDGNEKKEVSDQADSYGLLQTSERLRIIIEKGDETDEWKIQSFCDTDLEENINAEDIYVAKDYINKQVSLKETHRFILQEDEEDNPTKMLLLFAEKKPMNVPGRQDLEEHTEWVTKEMEAIIEQFSFGSDTKDAFITAAQWHDRGKNRVAWQQGIGNDEIENGEVPWAKGDFNNNRGYRHEFGSLREALDDENIKQHPESDLVLHLIACHHGWSRPHFKRKQLDIEGVSPEQNEAISFELMRRFARLQRRFGYWELAWLESLLRSADYEASRRLEAILKTRKNAQ